MIRRIGFWFSLYLDFFENRVESLLFCGGSGFFLF